MAFLLIVLLVFTNPDGETECIGVSTKSIQFLLEFEILHEMKNKV